MTKNLLFSVTAKDCNWDYIRGTGAGGQKRNKTSSKVRCTHPPSGAVATDDTSRSQHLNKRNAFLKMAETKEFKAWHQLECAKRLGQLDTIEKNVEKAMKAIKVEGRENGKWVPLVEKKFTGEAQ